MDRKSTILAAVTGLALASSAPAAFAHDHHDDACGCVRHEVVREVVIAPPVIETVSLPDSFFADTGGVGPAFIDTPSSGGSAGFVEANASASASAFASASASARVSIQFNEHQHMMKMQMMKMHMMKKSYHSKW